MARQIEEPHDIRDILDAKLDSLLILFVHLEHLDKKVDISSLLLLWHLLQSRVRRDVHCHIGSVVADGPLSETLQDALMHAHVKTVVL